LGQHVAEEVDPAALDGSARHDRVDGLAQAQVGVGDDQLHPGQPTGLQAAQERRPEGAVLAVADGEAQDLTAAIAAHPGGHDHGLGDDPAVHPGFAVGGVDKDVGEALAGQGPIPEGAHFAVQVGANPAHLALGDATVSAKRADQVVDLAGAHPMQIRLHHHREQGLVDPASPLEQAGEERPGSQLGDAQLQIPRRRSKHAGSVAVALGRPVRGALVGGGADHGGELGLDQRLVDGLGGLADAVIHLRGRECVQNL
jgi:hypothetical protein